MEWLSDWVKQIILLVMVATFFDLLLPNHSMERYVKLVMGLLIILAILSPLFQLMNQDFRLSKVMFALKEGWTGREATPFEQIQEDIKKLEKSQNHLIQQQTEKSMERIMTEQVEKKFAVEVVQAKIQTRLNQHQVPEITEIDLVAKQKTKEELKQVPIRAVEPVSVEINENELESTDSITKEAEKLKKEIINYLGEYWQISPSQIQISFEQPN